MGILSRFTDIMSANINSFLAKSEADNADKLLEKYLKDARDNLAEVKSEAATVLAEETGLARKLAENESECAKYGNYAAAAVRSGNDDDARKFLTYKSRLESDRGNLSADYARAKESSDKMRQLVRKLTDDIHEAESKMSELKHKLAVAKQKEKHNELEDKFSADPLGGVDSLFEAVQKRVDAADAAAALDEGFSSETSAVEALAMKYDVNSQGSRSDVVEDQLAMLKATMGKPAALNP